MLNPQYENEQLNGMTQTDSLKEKEIQLWLVKRLARELEISPQEIDIKAPFNRYGLDSLAAVHLVSDLEEWMGFEMSPTLPYDYPTVESLAGYLSSAAKATG